MLDRVPSLIAMVSSLGLIVGVVYDWIFFNAIEPTLFTALTIEDHVASALAIIPYVIFLYIAINWLLLSKQIPSTLARLSSGTPFGHKSSEIGVSVSTPFWLFIAGSISWGFIPFVFGNLFDFIGENTEGFFKWVGAFSYFAAFVALIWVSNIDDDIKRLAATVGTIIGLVAVSAQTNAKSVLSNQDYRSCITLSNVLDKEKSLCGIRIVRFLSNGYIYMDRAQRIVIVDKVSGAVLAYSTRKSVE